MKWALQWGPHLERLERSARSGPRPKPLEERPVIYAHLSLIWDAYQMLSLSRGSNGFGPQSITITDAFTVANYFELDPVEFTRIVQALDEVYMKHLQKEV